MWKISPHHSLPCGENFSTGSACGACDKYDKYISLLTSVCACAPVLQLFGKGVHLDYDWFRLCHAFTFPGWNSSLVRSGSNSFWQPAYLQSIELGKRVPWPRIGHCVHHHCHDDDNHHEGCGDLYVVIRQLNSFPPSKKPMPTAKQSVMTYIWPLNHRHNI